MNKESKNTQCRVISLCNQKGGVGKTTSSVALSAVLADMGYRVLLIDNDPQANSTEYLGKMQADGMQITIASIFEDLISFRPVPRGKGIVKTNEGFDLLPCDNTYSGVEVALVSVMNREYFMRKYIDDIRDLYDFILIDNPPNLGMLTVNALTASDELLIPAEAQTFSSLSVQQLLHTVEMIRQFPNPNLIVDGMFLTRFDGRRKEDRAMQNNFKNAINLKLLDTTIPISVKASEAASRKNSVFKYAPKCTVSMAYVELAREVEQIG